ncbi:MAG: benzoyl-CoA reductase subunit A [Acidobacteria bacterium]|nr:benzoyl-CoA reductase subunit A [Acidobacteriota bacterium]
MNLHVGIDLGSTTTKAVLLDEAENVVGRGITNSRSNYTIACRVALEEGFVQARFTLTRDVLVHDSVLGNCEKQFLPPLLRQFRLQQYLGQLERLREALHRAAEAPRHASHRRELDERIDLLLDAMVAQAPALYSELATRKSDFFRDLAAADYMHLAERYSDPKGIPFEALSGLFDTAILSVENASNEGAFERYINPALEATLASAPAGLKPHAARLREAVETARSIELPEVAAVGTGYGRQRLPFPKEQIRSEILCHGLGAHTLFPRTHTVLDIGGQDTKAIQVDANGIVTSFQMNDRCAAGCGRYLGYIADEMNLGLHELGPLAQQSRCRVKINSTCTVFAGAELRERLSLGQRREDILAGLHRAIVLRAMSLLARSGGVSEEFTFTGGVARNPAAVGALQQLIKENYGDRTLNVSPDSIYTGALGAALFALRGCRKQART